ncbi:hypothetical protein LJC74_09750, partial [Eubacteriales bacterium OttesenSCG-928-A19]|nr:hypothetical protein [Eubacteriales bacterium OttesenSCG-928-A19]
SQATLRMEFRTNDPVHGTDWIVETAPGVWTPLFTFLMTNGINIANDPGCPSNHSPTDPDCYYNETIYQ